MIKFKPILTGILLVLAFKLFAWNALGHRLVAQIAYDHMTVEAKQKFNRMNHQLDKIYRPQSFVNAATWLDTVKYQEDVNWFDSMHYVNQFFSTDGTALPTLQKVNAVWAIDQATKTLNSNKSYPFDKAIALRVLIHVTGDLHQPLHGAAKVSQAYPDGDLGGNLFHLGANPVADNLHSYWDQAGGLFKSKKRISQAQLAKKAQSLEKQFPCQQEAVQTSAKDWLAESHKLAISVAYDLKSNEKPSLIYQKETQQITSQRVALAGCRLAVLLNQMAAS